MKKKFSTIQIIFHWVILLLLVLTYASMELKGWVPKTSELRTLLKEFHFTLGVSVLLLMLIRVILKISLQDPVIVPTPPRWQTILAKAVQGSLYLLFIILPILGMLILYFAKVEWSFFSYTMPIISEPNPEMRHFIKESHELLARFGYLLIGLHTVAALFHHYIVGDNTLIRMLPWTAKAKR